MKRSSKSKQWIQQHKNDPWVQQAQKEGYRSRAAYKLLELIESECLFKPGDHIIDLGCAPGGWCQILADVVNGTGQFSPNLRLPSKRSRQGSRRASGQESVVDQRTQRFDRVSSSLGAGNRSRKLSIKERLALEFKKPSPSERPEQVASKGRESQELIAPRYSGSLIGVDLLEMPSIPGVNFVQGDFTSAEVIAQILEITGGNKLDAVVSDMSPDLSGVRSADQAKSISLCELVLQFTLKQLTTKGVLLIKVFQGAGFDPLLLSLRASFKSVKIKKPAASRDKSKEVYILARHLKV